MTSEKEVGYLNYLLRTYESVTKVIAETKQRLLALPGEDKPDDDTESILKGEGKAEGLLTVKGRLERAMEKELLRWDIWTLWLKQVPGIGPFLAAKLVVLFYYRFVPICKKCGGLLDKIDGGLTCRECKETAKKDGILKHRLELKDFPTISKWWAYMGRHTVDGVMPKRKKGIIANWSTPGRTVGFHIGDQFNRQNSDNPYKEFLLERKRKHERAHPDWSKGHIHNAAKNEAVKLFLAHFWHVARTLEGKPVSEPYAGAIMGHTNIIKPFYWGKSDALVDTPIDDASHLASETQRERASQRNYEIHSADASHGRHEIHRKIANRFLNEARV